MDASQVVRTVNTLCRAPQESECAEFKHNNYDPEEIGEYISALSNSAALMKDPAGFIIWGVDDATHDVLGTTFKPRKEKVKGQELENWLTTQLTPRLDFKIHEVEIDNLHVVVFEVPAARHTPIRFKDTEFIRVGSYKKRLKDFPEKESALWELLRVYRFEQDVAVPDVSDNDVLELLDYPAYFDLTNQPLPPNRDAILHRLLDEKIVVKQLHGGYDITNFGAVLFARDLSRFGRLSRKALRVIVYHGKIVSKPSASNKG
jgi:predicted HTH transcriptional regulator